MGALLFDGSAPRLDADHPSPHPPAGEALIRVDLAGICKTDLEILKGYMGFTGVLGHEFVGTVEQGPVALTAAAEPGHIKILQDPRS
jgi:D-arabinose 1-dehydrogenase-like Zn-dependent alcohol dehydrogenase